MGVIKRQGIKNIFITYAGVIIGALSAIFIQPAFLSSTELGFTRNLYNFSFLLSIAIPLGLPNVILRFYPQYKANVRDPRYFTGFILISFATAALLSVSLFLLFRPVLTQLYASESQLFVRYFIWVVPYSLIIALSTCLTCYSQAVYKSTVPSFLNDVVSRVMVVLITFLYYYGWISFDQYVIGFVSIYLLVSVVLVFYLSRFGLISFSIRKVFSGAELRRIIPYGLTMCLISFTSFGLKSIDAIFLGMYSLSDVAVYSTAVFLALFIEVPLGSIERISHSRIAANFASGNQVETGKIYSESVKYLLVFGGYIFLGVSACSGYIFDYLPPEYSRSAWLVTLLGLGCLVNAATGVNNAILFYTSYFRIGALLLAASFVVMLVADLIFIPRYGMAAAAFITTGISIVYNFSKFLVIYRLFGFQPYTLSSVKTILLIGVGYGFTLLLPAWSKLPVINILINGGLVTLFYFAGVYRLKIVPEIFSQIINRISGKPKP